MVARLAGLAAALALAAGCGKTVTQPSGPLDEYYFPTGLAVQRYGTGAAQARLLAVSTNADLRYDSGTGGSVIALEGDLATTTYRRSGAVNVRSYGGDLALIDPAACHTTAVTETMVAFATRGSNTLNLIDVLGDGRLDCHECGIPLTGSFADPLPITFVCSADRARASLFIGYTQGLGGEAYVTEYDLRDGARRTLVAGAGPVRGLTYDATRDRLFVLGLATGDPTPLKYVDLDGCTVGAAAVAGGCVYRAVTQPITLGTVEFRSMALATPVAGRPQRAFLSARVYDAGSAASAGARTTDLGGKLFVVDLVEGPTGLVLDLVDEVDTGPGAQDVKVLPRLPAWAADRGDVVAVLAVDLAFLWVYDSETRTLASIGSDPRTGSAILGGQPYGLAVDPQPFSTSARVYVGSFTDSVVTPIDVPLDAVNATTFAGSSRRVLTGAGTVP